MKPMKMSDPRDEQTPFQQLLAELDRLERERRTLDLRDQHAVDECQRKIDTLRKRITRYLHGRDGT